MKILPIEIVSKSEVCVLVTPGVGEQRLTRVRHSVMSGGEKSAAIHLDEAFIGIGEATAQYYH